MVEEIKKLAEQLLSEQELSRAKLLVRGLLEKMKEVSVEELLDRVPEIYKIGTKVLGRFDLSQFKQEVEEYIPMLFQSFPIISKRKSIRELLSGIEQTKLNISLPDLGLNMHMIIAEDKLSGGMGALEESDISLRASASTFLRMFTGELDPASAYMAGELEVEGDITRATALVPAIEGIRKELKLE